MSFARGWQGANTTAFTQIPYKLNTPEKIMVLSDTVHACLVMLAIVAVVTNGHEECDGTCSTQANGSTFVIPREVMTTCEPAQRPPQREYVPEYSELTIPSLHLVCAQLSLLYLFAHVVLYKLGNKD